MSQVKDKHDIVYKDEDACAPLKASAPVLFHIFLQVFKHNSKYSQPV